MGCGVGIEVLGLFIGVVVIKFDFKIKLGLILKKVGFYSIRLVSLFILIEFILLLILWFIVGLMVYLVM